MGVGQTYQWAVVLPASLGVRQDLVRPLDLLETLLSTGVFGVRSGWYFQTNL
jgi:hypothetical protein